MIKKITTVFLIFLSVNCFSQNTGKNRIDTDQDGIADVKDVDDDNDGIYDKDENKRKNKKIKRWRNRVNVKTSNDGLLFFKGYSGWNNGTCSIPFSEMGFSSNYEVSFYVKSSKPMGVGLGIVDESQSLSDIDYGFYFKNNTFRTLIAGEFHSVVYKYKHSDKFKIAYNGNELLFYRNNVLVDTIKIEAGLDFSFDSSFLSNSNGYGRGNINDIKIRSSFADLDLDNDGIINSLDLDSDGDGSLDVVEAGFLDEDGDGILGTGIPVVNNKGKITSNIGYGCEKGTSNGKGSHKHNADCVKLSFDFLNPNINSSGPASNSHGVTINTTDMSEAIFDITYNTTELLNQTSGLENSEVTIETVAGQDNEVFVKVKKSEKTTELNLKIVQLTNDALSVLVDYLGEWRSMAKEFYEIDGSKITFKNSNNLKLNPPFSLNLVNGVYYNQTLPLELTVSGNIDLTNASLIIKGPNNLEKNISPTSNSFSWNGSSAPIGNYKFTLQIQNKLFTGQFIISNN